MRDVSEREDQKWPEGFFLSVFVCLPVVFHSVSEVYLVLFRLGIIWGMTMREAFGVLPA